MRGTCVCVYLRLSPPRRRWVLVIKICLSPTSGESDRNEKRGRRRNYTGRQGSMGRPLEPGRCRCLAAFCRPGVCLLCVLSRREYKNPVSQQNIEITTDTSQMGMNHFDKGQEMITLLMGFYLKKQHLHTSSVVNYINHRRHM